MGLEISTHTHGTSRVIALSGELDLRELGLRESVPAELGVPLTNYGRELSDAPAVRSGDEEFYDRGELFST